MMDEAIKILRAGGVILYPTDTVWGLGCDASNAAAVERIYQIKRRVDRLSMIILVDSLDSVGKYVHTVPDVAWQLFEVADAPLTLILPRGVGVASNCLPPEGTIAIRIPDHRFCRDLTAKLRRPLVSTSANISGEKTPATFAEISDEIKSAVDYIVPSEWQGNPTCRPSSIIKVGAGGEIEIIRK